MIAKCLYLWSVYFGSFWEPRNLINLVSNKLADAEKYAAMETLFSLHISCIIGVDSA